jgi:hypothetical protein
MEYSLQIASRRPFVFWMLVLSTPIAAQTPTAAAWRELTRADVEAAHAIIARNHPGAVPDVGDTAFRGSLERAFAAARERAQRVQSYAGWLATLRAFTVLLDDPRITVQPTLSGNTMRWPGFVVSWRGERIVVASRDTSDAQALPQIGAEVLSCDDLPVAQYAAERLGTFRAVWSVEAERVKATPYLLVDDANPFLPLARHCVVRKDGSDRRVELRWRSITSPALQVRLRSASAPGNAGFGVRRVGDGWWIGMQSLDARAAAVVDSAAAHADQLRVAPWVVIDVRGNGGGSSEWGRRLATVLVGDDLARVAESSSTNLGSELCGESWRVSADVEKTIEGYIADFGPRFGPAAIAEWTRNLDSLHAARGRPQPRTGPEAVFRSYSDDRRRATSGIVDVRPADSSY